MERKSQNCTRITSNFIRKYLTKLLKYSLCYTKGLTVKGDIVTKKLLYWDNVDNTIEKQN